MIRYLHTRDGSIFREKRMLRMAPDPAEQMRQMEEKMASMEKKMEEMMTTMERMEKSMNKTKNVVNGPNFPAGNKGFALPKRVQNSPAAKDPRMQARMRQMGSVRNLDALLSVIPEKHRSGRDVKRCDPIPQPWTPEQRATIFEPTHPTMGRIRFENKGGQWVYKGIVMTPDELRGDQLGIQQKYADQEAEKKHYDRMLQINLNRARSGQPLPVDRMADYKYDEYQYQMAKGRLPVEQWDPNNQYNRPGYTFIPNTVASKRAAMGNRPQQAQPIAYRVVEADEPTPEERNAETMKQVNAKMNRINASIDSRKYDVPRIPNQTMVVTFPGSLLGYNGNTRGEILFKPREGVFADARSEMIAKQVGITFLTGPDGLQNNMSSVEIFFANEGAYTVQTKKTLYTGAGPVDSFEVKIDRAQMAIEQQKLKEVRQRPIPEIWGQIPSAALDNKEGRNTKFMYRLSNGVMQAYSPNAGLFNYNEANGKWRQTGGTNYPTTNAQYAEVFKNGDWPPMDNAQQPAAPNQPQQQAAPNQMKGAPNVAFGFDRKVPEQLLANAGIKVDDAWLKDEATWGKLNKALGSLGDDYKFLKGKTISMAGTNFPLADGFALPNDPDQDRVNGQLRSYVEFVKKNPAPMPVLKIENVPNEEPAPANNVPPADNEAPVEPVPAGPQIKPGGDAAPGDADLVIPPPKEAGPSAPEQPKSAGVEKNDAITEAQPDLAGLLSESHDESNMNRQKQKNCVRAVENGQVQFAKDFDKNVTDNGLFLTKSEVIDLFDKYKNGTEREKNLLKPVIKTIETHLASKMAAKKSNDAGSGVPNAPVQLPKEGEVLFKRVTPSNIPIEEVRKQVDELEKKLNVNLQFLNTYGDMGLLCDKLPVIEAAVNDLKPTERNFFKLWDVKIFPDTSTELRYASMDLDFTLSKEEMTKAISDAIPKLMLAELVESDLNTISKDANIDVRPDSTVRIDEFTEMKKNTGKVKEAFAALDPAYQKSLQVRKGENNAFIYLGNRNKVDETYYVCLDYRDSVDTMRTNMETLAKNIQAAKKSV